MKRVQNLGRAFTIIAEWHAKEQALHADVAAFGAPGECHAMVSRGESKREREARRLARSVSGLSRRQFNMAFKAVRRLRGWQRLEGQVYHRILEPWNH